MVMGVEELSDYVRRGLMVMMKLCCGASYSTEA